MERLAGGNGRGLLDDEAGELGELAELVDEVEEVVGMPFILQQNLF